MQPLAVIWIAKSAASEHRRLSVVSFPSLSLLSDHSHSFYTTHLLPEVCRDLLSQFKTPVVLFSSISPGTHAHSWLALGRTPTCNSPSLRLRLMRSLDSNFSIYLFSLSTSRYIYYYLITKTIAHSNICICLVGCLGRINTLDKFQIRNPHIILLPQVCSMCRQSVKQRHISGLGVIACQSVLGD